MLGQTTAILLVLALLAAALWFLRRKGLAVVNLPVAGGRGRHKHLQLMERVALTPHHSLHLVRVEDRVLLIGISPSGCQQLESFSRESFVTSAAGGAA